MSAAADRVPVLILTQCFPPALGGIEGLMGGLAGALVDAGVPIEVLADAGSAEARAHDASCGYPVRRFGGPKPLRRWWKAQAARGRAPAASHVICDSWKSLERVTATPRAPRGPRWICLAHGMELPSSPREGKAERIRRAFAKADRVLANSRATAALARPYLDAPGKLAVATPPIPPQDTADPGRMHALEARLGLRPGDGLVATLGRLEPRKGVDRLLAAVARLGERAARLRVGVAGDGPDRGRLEALAAELGLGERACFLGRVDAADKAALLARADVFAMPARRVGASVEGFGIVYLEAAWHGTPAIAGREGGAADAVLDGRTGLLCDGDAVDSVADALAQLLSNPARRATFGVAAAAHARAQLWSARLTDYLS